MSPSYTCALCVSCFQLVNSECFKKESQNESLPRIENKRGSAAVIGSTQGPPPPRGPHLSITALIMASPGAGWGSLSLPFLPPSLPPSPWTRGSSYPQFCFPWRQMSQGSCFIHHFRCEDTSHSGVISIILFNFLTLGPA